MASASAEASVRRARRAAGAALAAGLFALSAAWLVQRDAEADPTALPVAADTGRVQPGSPAAATAALAPAAPAPAPDAAPQADGPAVPPPPPAERSCCAGDEPAAPDGLATGGLAGRVLDPRGRPLAGVRVEAGSGCAVAATDAEGRFRLEGLRPGEHRARATCTGYTAAESVPVTVVAGGEAWAGDLHLGRGATLEGRVVDAAGRPVDGARVAYQDRTRRHALTDEEGAFALEGVPGGRVTLTATAAGHGPGALEVEVGPGDARGLLLRLPAPERRAGTVRDASGAPLQGAWVAPLDAPEEGARTGAGGRFELIVDDERPRALLVAAQGHAPALVDGRTTDVVLRPLATIGGARRELRRGGAPAAGLVVLAVAADGAAPVAGASDAAGVVELDLPAGEGPLELLVLDLGAERPRAASAVVERGAAVWDVDAR